MVVWSHRRSPGWLVRTVCAAACLAAGGTSSAAQGIDPPAAPPLPPPTGAVVTVASVAALQAAVNALTSGTTILIQPGTYRLTETLRIRNGVTKVALRGATSNRGDVTILGSGMTTEGVNIAIKVELASDVQIANLSVGEAKWHPIQMQGEMGAERVHIYNVRFFDPGEQFLKSTVDPSSPNGVDDVTVEYSLFEFTTMGPANGYTEGIDAHNAANWIIRYNLFRNIRVPPTASFKNRPAILMWRGSRNTLVYGNTIINCERGIIFGQGPENPSVHSHSGGAIYNNFIYRTEPVNADAGISIWDSPNTWVAHNTVIQNGTYPNAIEYRFPTTTGVHIANNLTDGAIALRDAAQATLVANFTQATAGMFVNAASGDLHLRPTATQAIDKGVALAQVTTDWDGQARPSGAGSDIGADEIADDPGGPGPPSAPGAPRNVGVVVNGSSATFSWHAPLTGDPPTSYALLAALSPGGPPVATLPLAVVTQATVSSVPPGTYYVRLIAMNAIGTSPASNEVTVIASGMQAPGAPLLSAALVHGSTVTLSWAPGIGDIPSSYVISASLTASGSAIGYLPISGTSITLQAPNGTYFVRVIAMNAAGAGPWSNEISVFVQ
jgi:pectate lyase